MISRVNLVILIDDDDVDNFAHERLLKKLNIADEIITFYYADEALEFLKTNTRPIDLILLDVNMPRMNGFEFLEKYQHIDEEKKSRSVVLMLGAGIDSVDARSAQHYNCVSACCEKPLTSESINQMLRKTQLDQL